MMDQDNFKLLLKECKNESVDSYTFFQDNIEARYKNQSQYFSNPVHLNQVSKTKHNITSYLFKKTFYLSFQKRRTITQANNK